MRVLIACEYSGIVRDAFIGVDVFPVGGFPGYFVSPQGTLYSNRTSHGYRKILKPLKPRKSGRYGSYTLCHIDGTRRSVKAHRIVAETLIPNPDRHPCVRHLDGDGMNNKVTNLTWGSYVDNEKDKKEHGLWFTRYNGKLTKSDRDLAFSLHNSGKTFKEIAEILEVSRPTVSRLINGKTWSKYQ